MGRWLAREISSMLDVDMVLRQKPTPARSAASAASIAPFGHTTPGRPVGARISGDS
jgi:hypothetical protein